MARIIGISPSTAIRIIQHCFICRLALYVKGQGVDGGRMSATVEFHGQLSACLAEIPQRKSEGDHLIELRRMGCTADPSDFTIARKEFGSLRGHRGLLHDQSYQM